MKYGWKPKIGLDEGFQKVYQSFLKIRFSYFNNNLFL